MNFDSLIESIKKKFNDERLNRSRKRLEKVWNFETPEDRIPFVLSKVPDGSGVNDDRLYESGYDLEEYLYYQLYQIQERAVLDDDYIPAFFPGLRQSAIPSAFGAVERKEGEHFWSKPIIKKPQDVYNLGDPDFNRKGSAPLRLLENIKYCRKMTKGNLPIHMSDMQGPMAAASTMWDVNDYLVAMYTNPEEVHYLHSVLTKAFIQFMDLQIEASEGDFIPIHALPFAWMPKEKGMSLSNDLLAVVGPKQLEEFSIPYDNQISNYYGGILIHSCGKFNQNLYALKKVKGLAAINFGATETDIGDIIEVFGGSILYIPHSAPVAAKPMSVEKQEDYIKRISKIIKDNNLPSQVLIMTPAEYSMEEVLKLSMSAIKEFSYS